MKKKLAIISSYHEACGIANYTERLEPVFRFYYDVTVLPLNTEILRSPEKGLITLGNKLIDEIADKVKEFDYVNIQFEVSLFGPSFNIVFNRVNKIIQNSRNLIFTFHSVNFSYTERRLITRHFLKTLKNQISSRRPYLFYDKLVKSIKTLDCKPDKKANIVVHDDKTKRYIERIYDFPHIYSHPLGYSNEKERQKTYTKDEAKSFRDEYFIEDNEKTIGLFGFVSEYKGHLVALQALRCLPDNYKVLIFGAQHPANIRPFESIDPYLKRLLDYIESCDQEQVKVAKNSDTTKKYSSRVRFIGDVNNEDFAKAMRCCDFVVLPYMEVNQMGSGIAALALENHAKIILANTKCFYELQQFYPGCFEIFDIGNYQQLAYIIQHFSANHERAISKALAIHNLENNVAQYIAIFER